MHAVFEIKMGNKKNKQNKRDSSHRHVFRKKKNPARKTTPTANKEQPTELTEEEQTVSIEGSRIINMDKLQQYTDNLTTQHNVMA